MSRKATRAGLKEHNRRLILSSVFDGSATSRVELSQYTGLAKPTVSDIVSNLIDEGFLIETGRGESTESGGKRPTLLQFCPSARQIISVSVNRQRATGVLANLDGTIVVRHYANLDGVRGTAILDILRQVINGLLAQLDAPLLCIGVSTPGIVDSSRGIVKISHSLEWHELPLVEQLQDIYNVPIHIGNNTELATRAQLVFGTADDVYNLVTIVMNAGIEIGFAFGGTTYHHSGDLGFLRGSEYSDKSLAAFLGWDMIRQRVQDLRQAYPETRLLGDDFDYLRLQYGYRHDDPVCQVIYEEIANHLAQILAWIAGLLRPDQVALAGEIVDLGEPLLALAVHRATDLLPPEFLDSITFSLAENPTLSVTGTIAFALNQELGVL